MRANSRGFVVTTVKRKRWCGGGAGLVTTSHCCVGLPCAAIFPPLFLLRSSRNESLIKINDLEHTVLWNVCVCQAGEQEGAPD